MKKGYELKIAHNSRGSWKEHIKFTKDAKEFMRKVDAIINSYGANTYASFKASLKINNGFGFNKENGTTIMITWKGRLSKIYNILPFPDSKGRCIAHG